MLGKLTIETTQGDPTAALTDEAALLARNKRELDRQVSAMLSNLLVVRPVTREMNRETA